MLTRVRALRRLSFAISSGCPELKAALDAGHVTVAAAAELARLPADTQLACLHNREVRKRVVRMLRSIRGQASS
jgi:hypothetical protein